MTPMAPPTPGGKSKSTTVLVTLLVAGGLGAVCCIGTLAAIAVPNFLRFNVRAKQAEVKSNLRMAYTALRSYQAERDEYSVVLEEVGFAPERGNRYGYFTSGTGAVYVPGDPPGGKHTGWASDPRVGSSSAVTPAVLRAAIPPDLARELGLQGCPEKCRVTVVAVGNLDTDATFDVWSVSTEDRVLGGESVKAGTPHLHVDDTRE